MRRTRLGVFEETAVVEIDGEAGYPEGMSITAHEHPGDDSNSEKISAIIL
jgi:hypothetical protein